MVAEIAGFLGVVMRQGNRTFRYAAAALLAGVAMVLAGVACAESTRIKDLGKVQGWRENALVGYGIVTGLAGTGDSPTNRTTRQALSNVFSQFNLTVPPEQVQSRNVAVVMVSASLPPFAREGDTLDVTVSSAGDARSLVGGSLLVTPLKGPNGRIYALAQGALSVGVSIRREWQRSAEEPPDCGFVAEWRDGGGWRQCRDAQRKQDHDVRAFRA